jgi:hypothetical protein
MTRWRKSPEQLVRRLQRAEKKVLAEVKGETGKIARRLDRESSKKIFLSKNVSKQDSADGRSFRQPKIKAHRVEALSGSRESTVKIEMISHYTNARSKALKGVVEYLGLSSKLERSGLYLQPGKKRGQRPSPGSRFKFVSFSSSQRLLNWANRPDKGQQKLRHVILLNSKILEALIMNPLIRKNEKNIKLAWRRALKEWKS